MGILEVSRGHVRIRKRKDVSRGEEEAQVNIREKGSDRKSDGEQTWREKNQGVRSKGNAFQH